MAALVFDNAGRVLLVRKRGTKAFIQPGGKLHEEEAPLEALGREMFEELTCSFPSSGSRFLGSFTAPAANEDGCTVEAALYQVQIYGPIEASAEIGEILRIDPRLPHSVVLAPLTRDKVPPLSSGAARVAIAVCDLSRAIRPVRFSGRRIDRGEALRYLNISPQREDDWRNVMRRASPALAALRSKK